MPTWKVPPVEPCDSATIDDIMTSLDTFIPPSTPAESCNATSSTRTLPIVHHTPANVQVPANVILSAIPATVPTLE